MWTIQGWVYLAVVLDIYSRKIVGCSIDKYMETPLIKLALNMAISLRQPGEGLLHHSDRGSQYASKTYRKLLTDNGIIFSMSSKGNCWHNAPTERFFSSLKREWVTGNIYPTKESAVHDVNLYITYYNSHRLHTTIGDMTPMEFEKCA
ncbi:MAG: IS3 family transposase [Pseudomonadales bacterium]|nr:IS3 family transposase [Pseudomonadales bacterium]